MNYDIDKLYHCTIMDFSPIDPTNTGGVISMMGVDNDDYNTVVYDNGDKYIDINNRYRIINSNKYPQGTMPHISNDTHLYTLREETLVKYSDTLPENKKSAKTLQRRLFRRERLI